MFFKIAQIFRQDQRHVDVDIHKKLVAGKALIPIQNLLKERDQHSLFIGILRRCGISETGTQDQSIAELEFETCAFGQTDLGFVHRPDLPFIFQIRQMVIFKILLHFSPLLQRKDERKGFKPQTGRCICNMFAHGHGERIVIP